MTVRKLIVRHSDTAPANPGIVRSTTALASRMALMDIVDTNEPQHPSPPSVRKIRVDRDNPPGAPRKPRPPRAHYSFGGGGDNYGSTRRALNFDDDD